MGHNQLLSKIARYHETRLTWWTRAFLVVPLIIGILGFITLRMYTNLLYEKRLHQHLTIRHKNMARHWGAYQKNAKLLKALTSELNLFSNPFPHDLAIISDTLPEKSILTSLSYTQQLLFIKGYADSSDELTSYLLALSSQLHTPVTLIRSYSKGFGVYFEIAITPYS